MPRTVLVVGLAPHSILHRSVHHACWTRRELEVALPGWRVTALACGAVGRTPRFASTSNQRDEMCTSRRARSPTCGRQRNAEQFRYGHPSLLRWTLRPPLPSAPVSPVGANARLPHVRVPRTSACDSSCMHRGHPTGIHPLMRRGARRRGGRVRLRPPLPASPPAAPPSYPLRLLCAAPLPRFPRQWRHVAAPLTPPPCSLVPCSLAGGRAEGRVAAMPPRGRLALSRALSG